MNAIEFDMILETDFCFFCWNEFYFGENKIQIENVIW